MAVVFLILVAYALFFGFLAAKAGVQTTKAEPPEIDPEIELDLAAAY